MKNAHMHDQGRCRSCGADIQWGVTENGARMPMDLQRRTVCVPAPDGRVKVVTGYESHFATCPNADRHRTAGGS